MKFYYFGGVIDDIIIKELEDSHVSGVLFTYNPYQGDFFTLLARTMDLNQKIKYMIAIRPYAVSAQYLCMINQSINSIMKDRVQINLIAGHVKRKEIDFGGFVDEITDHSSIPERSTYLIKYINELSKMAKNPKIQIPDYYVSSTNMYLFQSAAALGCKIILPYQDYKNKHFVNTVAAIDLPDQNSETFTLEDKEIMVAINPILRETREEINKNFPEEVRSTTDSDFFSYKEFYDLMKKLEKEGINEVMLGGWPISEKYFVLKFIKEYTESEGKMYGAK
jgi:hypothetical protein